MFFKKILVALTLLLTVACGSDNKNTTLVVGTNAEFPPFEYLEDNNITGFDIELIKAIAQELKREIRIENLSWEGLLPALQGKKIDLIIAGMTATPDRAKVINFSDPYYLATNQVVITPIGSDIQTFNDISGKRAGAVLGFTGEVLLEKLTTKETTIQRYNNAYQAISALEQGKVDAVVLDSEPAKNYLKNKSNILQSFIVESSQENYSIAVRKDDTQLLTDINKAIQTLQANGVYNTIYNKYFQK